jgi:ribokinase
MALAEGKPLVEAVQFANCAGALACTQLGVIPGLGHRPQVEALYRQTYG